MKHRGWIFFSGLLWMAIGVFLTYKGLHLISDATARTDSLCYRFSGIFGSSSQAGTGLIAIGLLIGFLKGRFVLSKSVQRVVDRIRSLSLPIRFTQVYSRAYLILIGSMIALGFIMKILPIPIDARGFVDVAIGSALVNGAMLYFRAGK